MKPAAIREDTLRDPRYPVHRIADRLLPYLRVLVEQFKPEQVILFGSYAYGNPDDIRCLLDRFHACRLLDLPHL